MRSIAGHIVAGVILGAVFGLAYFTLEPLFSFYVKYPNIGVPLVGLFGTYLTFGAVLGLIAGLITGVVSAFVGARFTVLRHILFYGVGFAVLLTAMIRLRSLTLSQLGAVLQSGDTVVILVAAILIAAVAVMADRILARRETQIRVGAAPAGALLIVVILTVLGSHALAWVQENRLPRRADATDDRPNIVLFLLDALRPDYMSAYGHARETTPNIDRLAEEGVLFRDAHSHGNRTILAMPAVFTSLYPSFNGAIARGQLVRPLSESWTTLAEMLQERGYTTIGVMSNVYLTTVFGMTQGFDKTEEFGRGPYNLGLIRLLRKLGVMESPAFLSTSPNATEVTDAGLRWLESVEDRPFFLYMHYMDPHHPYIPPPPYDRMFGGDVLEPRPGPLFDKTVKLLKGPRPLHVDSPELHKLKDYYDGSIRYCDDEIGRLIEQIRRIAAERETIVIITSDHGDEFLEHGSLYHTNLVIEELLRVPLIVWSPKRFKAGTEIEPMVRHVDLLPTIAELTGATPPDDIMGESLVSLMEGGVNDFEVPSFAEGDFCASLNYQGWKIMRVDSTDSYHLFNLEGAGEYEDISAAERAVMEAMRARLDEYLQEAETINHTRTRELLDADTIRQLKALGYL